MKNEREGMERNTKKKQGVGRGEEVKQMKIEIRYEVTTTKIRGLTKHYR